MDSDLTRILNQEEQTFIEQQFFEVYVFTEFYMMSSLEAYIWYGMLVTEQRIENQKYFKSNFILQFSKDLDRL